MSEKIPLKVLNSKELQKMIIALAVVPFDIMFVLLYFFGFEEPATFDTIIMAVIIIGLPLFGVFTYLIIRKFTRTYYLFDKNGLCKMKKEHKELNIKWNQIYEIFYIRMRWLLLFQFGAGYLIIRYDDGKQNQHNIALSLKQVNLISKKFNINIKIK